MNTTTKLLGQKVFFKAQKPNDHLSYSLVKWISNYLTVKAKNKLMSSSIRKVHEGCWDIELINEADLDNSPQFKAYKPIIKSIIGEDAPIMRLHIKAVAMVAGMTSSLQRRHSSTTITEMILNNCKGEIEDLSDLVLLLDLGLTKEQGISDFSN